MSQDTSGYYLSPLQANLYSDFEGNPPPATFVVEISGDLDVSSLREAIAVMNDDHELLATRYTLVTGTTRPLQILGEDGLSWRQTLDLRTQAEPTIDLSSLLREVSPTNTCGLVLMPQNRALLLVWLEGLSADSSTPTVFTRELARCYAQVRGKDAGDWEAMQYIDYAEWQNQTFDEVKREEMSTADEPDMLLPNLQAAKSGFVPKTVPVGVFPQRQQPGAFLLACWHAYLSRLLDRDQLRMGLILPGRIYDELEVSLGLMDPVMCLTMLRQQEHFESVCEHAALVLTEAVASQRRYFRAGSSPLYGLSLQTPLTDLEVEGVRFSQGEQQIYACPFHLHLIGIQGENGIRLQLQYNAKIVDDQRARHLAEGLNCLVQSLLNKPALPLDAHPMLGPTESRLLLEKFNNNQEPVQAACIHELFQQQVAATPDHPAVFYEGHSLSYAQLNQRANQIAHFLIDRGIGSEDIVALCLHRSEAVIALLLGILKAGATYVSLERGEPARRLAMMVADCHTNLLFHHNETHPELPALLAEDLAVVDPRTLDLSVWPTTNPEPRTTPESLAYVIYTSGSTGKPKGVAVAHSCPVNLLRGLETLVYANLPQRPLRIGLNAPLSFDASMQQMITLTKGHTLYVLAQKTRLDGHAFIDYLARHELDAIDCTPTHLNMLVASGLLESQAARTCFLVAGSAVEQHLWDRLASLAEGRFFNIYGPTECTVDASGVRIAEPGTIPSIGGPLANYRLVILNNQGQAVAEGTSGELHIGGAGLARGYWQRPALTAERFVPDPFCLEPGQRLYRTGDLVRFGPGLRLLFQGRIDHQVKVRGFRVELGEIANVLCAFEGVQQALARVCDPDGSGNDQRLVAYYTTNSAIQPETHELRQFVEQNLPEHMVPSYFVLLPKFPLKPNGKLDEKALPIPDFHQAADSAEAAHLPVEEILVGIWEEVLEVEGVGMDHDFFALGGHSLLATQLVSRIRSVLDVDFNLQDLFTASSARAMANHIRSLSDQKWKMAMPPLTAAARPPHLPLSFAQQRLWTIQMANPQSTAFNIPIALRIKGPLDVACLEQSFAALMTRHESQRTTFRLNREGVPEQVVAPPNAWKIEQRFLEDDSQVQAAINEHAAIVFDLEQGPLVRVCLLVLESDHHVLLINQHHIITDGWSTGKLVDELGQVYNALRANREVELAPLQVQYADYALWQRSWLKDSILNQQIDYWSQRLEGLAAIQDLPAAVSREQKTSGSGVSTFQFPPELSAAMLHLAKRQGATLFMTLLATFKTLVHYHTGNEDIAIGTDVANRNHLQVENIIGFFINQLVLRSRLNPEASFNAFLAELRQNTLEAYHHQDLPFDKVVEVLNPKRQVGLSPLFQMKFVMQNAPTRELEIDDLIFSYLDTNAGTGQMDLQLNMWQDQDQLWGQLYFANGLYTPATIKTLLRQFQTMAELIVEDPERSLAQLTSLLKSREAQHREIKLAAHQKKKSAFAKFKRPSQPERIEYVGN